MKMNTKKSSDASLDFARLEYMIKRRELELEHLREELKGEKEINSLCAAFLMYMLIKHAEKTESDLSYVINKEEANLLIGKYFSSCEDTGDNYKLSFFERDSAYTGESIGI